MKKAITIIALATVGIILRAENCKKNKFSLTVTNNQNELLVDLTHKNIIFHEDIKVYVNNHLVN
ncbi:hypothetical protein ACEN32_02605 [Marinilactibacillus psychrotolerans]|uniref:hypothetical protein n=1 Tax=Marinilactibacillus psychrotolerans TaxID=191770 RepID=UPI003887F72A